MLVVAGAYGILSGRIGARRPTFAVSVHPPEFLSRFDHAGQPCTQERLFRLFAAVGYVARWVSVDHESHWLFIPSERADG